MRRIALIVTLAAALAGCDRNLPSSVLVVCECTAGDKDCAPSANVINVGTDKHICPPGSSIRATVLGVERVETKDGGAR